MLKVEVFQEGVNRGVCRGIKLGEYSRSSLRELTLINCPKALLECQKSLWNLDMHLLIYYKDVYDEEHILYDININCIEFLYTEDGGNMTFEGQMIVNHNEVYLQDIVDVFMLWGTGKELEWNIGLSNNEKSAYLSAARLYTNWKSEYAIQNTQVILDTDKIVDEYDFFYFIGEILLGNRGCFGSNVDRFIDFIEDLVKLNKGKKQWNIRILVKDLDKIKSIFKILDYKNIVAYLKYSGVEMMSV